MSEPVISVIMGVYNQKDEKRLLDAVNSILNQTFNDFEFIIWDDGSDSEGAKLIHKLGELDSRIILAGKEENRGLAYSLNECIRMARGKYIARMDADDISLPARFEKQIHFLEEHVEYAWCGTCAEVFDQNGTWGNRVMPEVPSMNDYFKYSPFIHPSVMFRADVFDENTGYLSVEQTLRCEDYEIFMNLIEKNLKGYNLQEILFRYYETRESYRKRTFKTRINEAKSRYRNYRKLGMLFPKGWIFVLRPVMACLIPYPLLEKIKRRQGRKARKKMEK